MAEMELKRMKKSSRWSWSGLYKSYFRGYCGIPLIVGEFEEASVLVMLEFFVFGMRPKKFLSSEPWTCA